jgi:hypothetical protein
MRYYTAVRTPLLLLLLLLLQATKMNLQVSSAG